MVFRHSIKTFITCYILEGTTGQKFFWNTMYFVCEIIIKIPEIKDGRLKLSLNVVLVCILG